jgi:hypothetical protein
VLEEVVITESTIKFPGVLLDSSPSTLPAAHVVVPTRICSLVPTLSRYQVPTSYPGAIAG